MNVTPVSYIPQLILSLALSDSSVGSPPSRHESASEYVWEKGLPNNYPILLAAHILPDALDFDAATSGETLPPPEGGMLPSLSPPCLTQVFLPGISGFLLLSRQGRPMKGGLERGQQ